MRKLLKDRHRLMESDSTWLIDEPKWYMLYVKSGNLKKVTDELNRQNIFTYRPVTKIEEFKKSTTLKTEQYLFTNNMFVHLSAKNLRSIPITTEKLSFVHWIDQPVSIEDDELEAMHVFLRKNANVYIQKLAMRAPNAYLGGYEINEGISTSMRQLVISSIDVVILSPQPVTVVPQRKFTTLREQLKYDISSLLFQLTGRTSARI